MPRVMAAIGLFGCLIAACGAEVRDDFATGWKRFDSTPGTLTPTSMPATLCGVPIGYSRAWAAADSSRPASRARRCRRFMIPPCLNIVN